MTKEIDYVELLKLAHEKLGSQSDMITELEKLLRDIEHAMRNENELLEMQKNQDVRDLEQQAKGVSDFFKSHKPRISMGKSAIWEIDDVLVDEAIEALKEQGK